MKNKIKTHKATVKRFKKSGTGKLRHLHQGNNHLKAGKSVLQKKRKRGMSSLTNKKEIIKILKMI